MTSGERLPKKRYERELFRLQAELVKLQEWVRVRHSGPRCEVHKGPIGWVVGVDQQGSFAFDPGQAVDLELPIRP